ncbi:uncharacterized protein FOMMEDRAFT_161803 [Fomitiporia mediterranea MF3/22]|uniref:uncharacterized protein n=1 Tax=Fomitiporia mediterranea (strain MF3/22) TaxID=694068 RepID=UPI0004407722|nr:uncharacterized protein FOMMEDRAFT_161803 [Fomitiporia mediterranea MF3/22]EJC98428.1 hypothetical protein FOMMEDRAFT_161803 [Fomitiporia mediterranea MF3/22]
MVKETIRNEKAVNLPRTNRVPETRGHGLETKQPVEKRPAMNNRKGTASRAVDETVAAAFFPCFF